MAYRITDIGALDERLAHEYTPCPGVCNFTLHEAAEAVHEAVVDAHVRREYGLVEKLPERVLRGGRVEQATKSLLSQNVHQKRAVHILERRFAVVEFRQRHLRVLLRSFP